MKHCVSLAALTLMALSGCNTAQTIAPNPFAGGYKGTYSTPDGSENGSMTLVIQPNNVTNGTMGRENPFPNSATISGQVDSTGAASFTVKFVDETPVDVSGSVNRAANSSALTGTLSRRDDGKVFIIQFTLFEPTS